MIKMSAAPGAMNDLFHVFSHWHAPLHDVSANPIQVCIDLCRG
jgi:hypothetical protein